MKYIHMLLSAIALSVLTCMAVIPIAVAITLSPAQQQQLAGLSSQQKADLARKAGVALPAGAGKTAIAPAKPTVIKSRRVTNSHLEAQMQNEAVSQALEKKAVSAATAEVLPVARVNNQAAADSLEVHRAFADFARDAKPLRVDTNLKQFGYELFAGSPDTFAPETDVPVPAEYVLGPGDELNVHLYGRSDQDMILVVDREGEIAFPSLGPISVVGMSFSEVKAFIALQVKEKMVGVTVDISMGKLRSIRVFALGDVERPGSYTVSGLSTIANALYVSGGISKTGSLRNIQLKRNGQIMAVVDLYDYLLKGDTSDDVRLLPGDVVFVPPLGKTAGVAGQVLRPAIYELKHERSVTELIKLAGGLLPTAYKDMALIERIAVGGGRSQVNVSLLKAKPVTMLKNGDVLKVFAVSDYQNNPVYLLGHVKRPGKYVWSQQLTLTDILPSMADLLPEAKLEYALVERETGANREPSIFHFNLQRVLNKQEVLKLQPRDKVYVFARAQLRQMPTVDIAGSVKKPGKYELKKNMHLLDLIMAAGGVNEDADLRKIEFIRVQHGARRTVLYTYAFNQQDETTQVEDRHQGDGQNQVNGQNQDDITVYFDVDEVGGTRKLTQSQNPVLQSKDRVVIHSIYEKQPKQMVRVTGQVNHPGEVELARNMRIADLVFAGGNLNERAYVENAELTRYVIKDGEKRSVTHIAIDLRAALAGDETANILLEPHDVLMVRSISNWRALEQVELKGEFKFPGVYTIEEGESIEQVIERAGGVTKDAYISAAVFLRQSIREQQQQRLNESLDRLEKELALSEAANQNIRDPKLLANKMKGFAVAKVAADKLRAIKPQGRLIIDLDKHAQLKEGARLKLVNGDVLMIPKRPDQVLVLGEVYNQTAMLYHKHMNQDDMIAQAGGVTTMADEERIYIVRANGSIDTSSSSGWGRSKPIYPGDTIVVPQKLDAFNLLDSTLDWSKVLMQIGVFTAAMRTVGIL